MNYKRLEFKKQGLSQEALRKIDKGITLIEKVLKKTDAVIITASVSAGQDCVTIKIRKTQ